MKVWVSGYGRKHTTPLDNFLVVTLWVEAPDPVVSESRVDFCRGALKTGVCVAEPESGSKDE